MEEPLAGTQPMQRPRGAKRLVYWSGRILQVAGLMLLGSVLLIFSAAADIGALLYTAVVVSVVMFYTGWACVSWAKS